MRLTLRFLLLTLLFACSAENEPSKPAESNPPIVYKIEYDTKEFERVKSYWTAERINSAIPTPIPVYSNHSFNEIAPENFKSGDQLILSNPALPDDIAEPFDQELLARKAVRVKPASYSKPVFSPNGKLFYTNKGTPFVCSAAAVHKKTIVTAAHCLYNRENQAHSKNIVFISQFYKGSQPFVFTASYTVYPGDWQTSGYRYSDHALINVDRDFTSAVGWYGLIVRPRAVLPGGAFGYPAAPPFPGDELFMIAPIESTSNDPSDAWTIGIYSDMTPGSSGGIWLGHNGNKFGYVFGINAYNLTDNNAIMYSPWFHFLMEGLWKCAVEGDTSNCGPAP